MLRALPKSFFLLKKSLNNEIFFGGQLMNLKSPPFLVYIQLEKIKHHEIKNLCLYLIN